MWRRWRARDFRSELMVLLLVVVVVAVEGAGFDEELKNKEVEIKSYLTTGSGL